MSVSAYSAEYHATRGHCPLDLTRCVGRFPFALGRECWPLRCRFWHCDPKDWQKECGFFGKKHIRQEHLFPVKGEWEGVFAHAGFSEGGRFTNKCWPQLGDGAKTNRAAEAYKEEIRVSFFYQNGTGHEGDSDDEDLSDEIGQNQTQSTHCRQFLIGWWPTHELVLFGDPYNPRVRLELENQSRAFALPFGTDEKTRPKDPVILRFPDNLARPRVAETHERLEILVAWEVRRQFGVCHFDHPIPKCGPDHISEEDWEERAQKIIQKPKHRRLFILKAVGCSNKEIAQIFGISESSVNEMLRRDSKYLNGEASDNG